MKLKNFLLLSCSLLAIHTGTLPALATISHSDSDEKISKPCHIFAAFSIQKSDVESFEATAKIGNSITRRVHREFTSEGFETHRLRPLINAKLFELLNAPESKFPTIIAIVIDNYDGFGVVTLPV
jgi:hypothetical protein